MKKIGIIVGLLTALLTGCRSAEMDSIASPTTSFEEIIDTISLWETECPTSPILTVTDVPIVETPLPETTNIPPMTFPAVTSEVISTSLVLPLPDVPTVEGGENGPIVRHYVANSYAEFLLFYSILRIQNDVPLVLFCGESFDENYDCYYYWDGDPIAPKDLPLGQYDYPFDSHAFSFAFYRDPNGRFGFDYTYQSAVIGQCYTPKIPIHSLDSVEIVEQTYTSRAPNGMGVRAYEVYIDGEKIMDFEIYMSYGSPGFMYAEWIELLRADLQYLN